ncbi:MAG: NAD-dependent epimerase/dehydratase family protein [Alistipes sp.]|nr:NAD-dependent epimerase/dehydratase family protein [Alistipes sp.]
MRALVIGGTGLVGRHLVNVLMADERFSEVAVFARRSTGLAGGKLTEHLVDFGDPSTWRELVRGDVLFSTLGTTLKEAGSKLAQYEVDYNYQLNFATAAAGNGVGRYALVSTVGADAGSMFFYLRIKGELEEKVLRLPFSGISILRPTQLYGEREQPRRSEERALSVMKFFNGLGLMKGRRPVHARTVTAALVEAALTTVDKKVYEAKDIRLLSSRYNEQILGD